MEEEGDWKMRMSGRGGRVEDEEEWGRIGRGEEVVKERKSKVE